MISQLHRSILIIHPGSLGDVLLSLRALESIRMRNPGQRIILLAAAEIGSLLETCGVVDQILSTESGELASLLSGAAHVSPRLRNILGACEFVVGWLRDSDGELRRTLEELGIGGMLLEAPTPRDGVHQSKRFMQVLGEDESEAIPFHLVVPIVVKQGAADYLRTIGIQPDQQFVAVHPGSGSVHKCVGQETIVAVIRTLQQRRVAPVIVGGPADDMVLRQVKDCGLGEVPIAHGQHLSMIAGILAQASLFIGHDSGITHLAAALHTPTVAIFGPTKPQQWAPLGHHVSVVTGPSCSCPTWDHVRACEGKPCLSISAEAVTDLCVSLLRRYPEVTKS